MSAVTETYEEFRGSTVSVYSAGASQVDDGLLEIVRVEGPTLEEALYQRYVKRGGGAMFALQTSLELFCAPG